MSDEGNPAGSRPTVFLERQSYRRRRLTDAARLLPYLGAALFCVPLLWPDATDADQTMPLSSAILYVFACWGLLIFIGLAFGIMARLFSAREPTDPDAD